MINKGIEKQKLEEINRENLLNGLDSEGRDMPFYSNSPGYAQYGFEKFRQNPKNKGKWDLKLTGQYHRGIYTVLKNNNIYFRQKFRNKKIQWLDMMLEKANRNPLGITEKQMREAEKKNLKRTDVRGKIIDIINKGK